MEFFSRLSQYFESVGSALAGQSKAATIFANAADIGDSREAIYAKFLEQHLPHWCDVERGGYLFSVDGEESGQIDIIVSSGSAPKYAFFNDGSGKAFRQIDGALAAISIKSKIGNDLPPRSSLSLM